MDYETCMRLLHQLVDPWSSEIDGPETSRTKGTNNEDSQVARRDVTPKSLKLEAGTPNTSSSVRFQH